MACTGPRVPLNQPSVRPSLRNSCTLRIAATIIPLAERSESSATPSGKGPGSKASGVGSARVVRLKLGTSAGALSSFPCTRTTRELTTDSDVVASRRYVYCDASPRVATLIMCTSFGTMPSPSNATTRPVAHQRTVLQEMALGKVQTPVLQASPRG